MWNFFIDCLRGKETLIIDIWSVKLTVRIASVTDMIHCYVDCVPISLKRHRDKTSGLCTLCRFFSLLSVLHYNLNKAVSLMILLRLFSDI